MAIGRDLDTLSSNFDTNNFSFSHTCTGASLLVVTVHSYDNVDVSAATYGGVSMTEVHDQASPAGNRVFMFYLENPSEGANTIQLTHNALEGRAYAASYTGTSIVSPLDVAGEASGTNTNATVDIITTQANDLLVCGAVWDDEAESGTPHADFTEQYDAIAGSGIAARGYFQDNLDGGAAATETIDVDITTSIEWGIIAAGFKIAEPIEQEGFAFGDDNGSESAHTLDTQDTNTSAELGTKTLRVLLNAETGSDPPSQAFGLQFDKNSAGSYAAVPTSATTPSTVTFVGVGTSPQGTGAVTPTEPSGIQADDILILVIEGEGEDTSADSPPTGGEWTAVDGSTGSVASATDGAADRTRCTVYYHIYDGATSPNYTVPDAGNHTGATVMAFRGIDPDDPIDATQSSSNSTNSTSFSATGVTTNVDNVMIVVIGTRGDNGAGLSSVTNANLESITQAFADSHSSGSDGSYSAHYGIKASAGATGTTTATIAVSEEQANWTVALKPLITTNEVYISASANVAAGGEATTARLTAPSGKTTADFDTGRRWDDENGSDSLDITSEDYTEVEWVLTTQSPAAANDTFDFRVYTSGNTTPLETYTVTPRWTIGGGAAGIRSMRQLVGHGQGTRD